MRFQKKCEVLMRRDVISFLSDVLICVLFGAVLFIIGIKYVFPAILPFLLAWAIAFCVRPIAAFVGRHFHIPERPVRAVLALLVLVGIGALTVFLVLRVGSEIVAFFSGIVNDEKIMNTIGTILNPTLSGIGDGEIFAELEEKLSLAVSEMISSLISRISSFITAFVSRIPGTFIFIITLVIAVVYFSLDLERINSAVRRLLPKKLAVRATAFKEQTLSAALVYMRSYLILMLMTFAIILIGLLILRVDYALMLAVVIALLDALPVIGVGTVLVPWSVFCLLTDDIRLGVGLLVLFVVISLVRHFAEPKIVGKSLGIHPLITLLLIYLGYSFFGVAGLVLMPIFAALLANLSAKDKSAEVQKRRGSDE